MSGVGTQRAATSVEEPGAARLAGDASGPSRERRPLPRHRERPPTAPPRERRPQRFPTAKPPPTKGSPPAGAVGSAVQGRDSQAKAALVASLAKPVAPPDREAGVPTGPPSGAAPWPAAQPSGSVRPQPRSIRSADADPRQPIVTARPRPGDGARRREAWLRAVERGRAASPARGVCSPPNCEPFDIFFAILKSVVHLAAVSEGTDQFKSFSARMHMSGYAESCRCPNYLSPINTAFAVRDNSTTPAAVSAPGAR